jgi:hypothetical protein
MQGKKRGTDTGKNALKSKRTKWEVYATFDDKMDAENSKDDFISMGQKAKVERISAGWAVYQEVD